MIVVEVGWGGGRFMIVEVKWVGGWRDWHPPSVSFEGEYPAIVVLVLVP